MVYSLRRQFNEYFYTHTPIDPLCDGRTLLSLLRGALIAAIFPARKQVWCGNDEANVYNVACYRFGRNQNFARLSSRRKVFLDLRITTTPPKKIQKIRFLPVSRIHTITSAWKRIATMSNYDRLQRVHIMRQHGQTPLEMSASSSSVRLSLYSQKTAIAVAHRCNAPISRRLALKDSAQLTHVNRCTTTRGDHTHTSIAMTANPVTGASVRSLSGSEGGGVCGCINLILRFTPILIR